MGASIEITAMASDDSHAPVAVTIKAQDGELKDLIAIGPDGQPCEVVLHFKYQKPAANEEGEDGGNGGHGNNGDDGDECVCCSPGPGGRLICVQCDCTP